MFNRVNMENLAIPKTQIHRHPERSVPEEFQFILERGRVAHVGFCQNGQPYVIPFSYHFDSKTSNCIYLHGAHGSRALQLLGAGAPVCVEVTLVDGLLYSRTAIDHSMNYHSAVCFGRAQWVTNNDEKAAVFEKMVSRYFPGRKASVDYEAAPASHLEGTALLEVILEAWSAKARCGGPNGPLDHEANAAGSAGVLPVDFLV